MNSPLKTFLLKIAKTDDPHGNLDAILDEFSIFEQCALAFDWESWWARPEQLPPEHRWASWGGLTGRGWGKTRAMSEFVNQEVREGRSKQIALMAQDEEACANVMVEGPSGILATAHPDCKAAFEKGQVYWENGATATIFTPKNPSAIFGDEFDLVWLSEIHAWPKATMMKAWSSIRMCLRVGRARLIWDSNPSRKHPIIKQLLERGELYPEKHVVFRGTTFENLDNLNSDVVEEWQRDYGGTMVGKEMLEGQQLDEDDGADFKQIWIDANRRALPNALARRIISIDPAISTRPGTDDTGMVDMGIGVDEQVYVIEDLTDKYTWEKWGVIAVERYFLFGCDCIVIERNRGGDACAANLRAAAKEIDKQTVIVSSEAVTRHSKHVIYIKEVNAAMSKQSRGKPVAALCQKGRISHVLGADFTALEEQQTTFEDGPGVESPNTYDACNWGAWELFGLARKTIKPGSFTGVAEANRMLSTPQRRNLSALLGAGRGRTI